MRLNQEKTSAIWFQETDLVIVDIVSDDNICFHVACINIIYALKKFPWKS